MATTGFWPVKSRLKEVIDYAENPDKTIDKNYVDSDLYAALQYAADDKKTDERMYVSGINCNAKRAYERMTATKKRFGKTGGNVAYHGYQSFQTGEVTPEEAHKIGIETARRMWDGNYEIVVTTHLNTDNIHNHFVINSVSFKTGRKFENHISDHYRLREISDAVCLDYGKSVLKEANFYGGDKKEYWLKKKGNMTHRELLKSDIDTAISQSTNFKAFEIRLKDMGYIIQRGEEYAHYSVKAPSWQRAIRLDRLGKEYSPSAIRERLLDNQHYIGYVPFQKPKYAPLIMLEIEYRKVKKMDGVQVMFQLVIELCKLITGNNITPQTPRPLSPEMRQEVVKLDKTLKEYKFLCENHIDSPQELVSFISEKREQIDVLEKERQSVYNRNRHKTSLRIRRVPVRSFLFYGRTLSGGIGDFKFKYSLVVGCRLVMPGNRTRRKLEITKSQRTTVHRSNFRRITRSVFRKAVADGQNLERIIWFRFFAGILRAPQLELLRTGVSAGGQTDNGDIFRRFADLHIHRLVEGHRNAVRDNAFVLIQILCRFRGVYPVAVRQAVERRINPQMIESIARIKGVLCPVIPFRRGLPVIMLRRIPVAQRADHIRDRITAVHIAVGNIHGDPAGGRDRIASVLAAEQVFGLYRLNLLRLTVELKLLRAGVVQRVVNGDHRHALDFPVERDGGRRRFAVHIVCNNAFLSIQRIRIV